jgi:hypothetical protein
MAMCSKCNQNAFKMWAKRAWTVNEAQHTSLRIYVAKVVDNSMPPAGQGRVHAWVQGFHQSCCKPCECSPWARWARRWLCMPRRTHGVSVNDVCVGIAGGSTQLVMVVLDGWVLATWPQLTMQASLAAAQTAWSGPQGPRWKCWATAWSAAPCDCTTFGSHQGCWSCHELVARLLVPY